MYSPGLKKLGAEFGLTAGKGRVYGLLEGFPVSMWDGAGTKNMLIYLGEPRDAAEDAQTDLQALLPRELEAYRIMQYELVDDLPLLLVVFHDNPGTLKRIRQFLQEAVPALREAGLSQVYYCAQCGKAFEGAPEIDLVDGTPVPVHAYCREDFAREIEEDEREEREQLRQESAEALLDGSIFKGVLGAFLGALVGAIPWVHHLSCSATSPLIGGILIGAGAVYRLQEVQRTRGRGLCGQRRGLYGADGAAGLHLPATPPSLFKLFVSGEMAPLQMSDYGWLFRSVARHGGVAGKLSAERFAGLWLRRAWPDCLSHQQAPRPAQSPGATIAQGCLTYSRRIAPACRRVFHLFLCGSRGQRCPRGSRVVCFCGPIGQNLCLKS